MLNRNYGKLRDDARIIYAPSEVKVGNTYYPAPTAEQYAACGYLPIVSEPPEKLGVTYTPTEYGDLRPDPQTSASAIVRRYAEHPIVAPVPVYSVEEVIYSLITRGKLQPVKAVLGDLYDLITMRDTVSADNEILVAEFPRIKAALIADGIMTDDEIAEILKEAEVR